MTDQWEQAGLWENYQADYAERFANKPYVVRPSVLPLEHYADVYVGQQAKRYLETYDRAEPWFCWVSFGGPHEPWDTPEPYASMYDPAAMPKPIPKPAGSGDRPRGVLDTSLENAPALAADEIAAMRANYAGNITLIDDQVGEILDVIERRGELDNTVILFCSDHGEMNGDCGLIYKSVFLNGAVRVPLLVRTPATATSAVAGTTANGPVEWFDIGPTLVELAGGTLNHRQFARSLCPTLAAPATGQRAFAVSEIFGEIMYLDHQWKLMLNADGQPYGLFDQVGDPDETTNRVTDPATADVQAAIRIRIQEHLVRTQARR